MSLRDKITDQHRANADKIITNAVYAIHNMMTDCNQCMTDEYIKAHCPTGKPCTECILAWLVSDDAG